MKRICLFHTLLAVILLLSCGSAHVTQLKHASDFSNIRSQVKLANGEIHFGYATLYKSKGDDVLRLAVPGKKEDMTFQIGEIERMLVEDQEFIVKMIETPSGMVKDGHPRQAKAMLKRVGIENDPIQVYEYKYGVRNPKSPIKSMHTAWYVSFPNDNPKFPLTELGSPLFKQKWAALLQGQSKNNAVATLNPSSVKMLLEAMRKMEIPNVEDLKNNFSE